MTCVVGYLPFPTFTTITERCIYRRRLDCPSTSCNGKESVSLVHAGASRAAFNFQFSWDPLFPSPPTLPSVLSRLAPFCASVAHSKGRSASILRIIMHLNGSPSCLEVYHVVQARRRSDAQSFLPSHTHTAYFPLCSSHVERERGREKRKKTRQSEF